MSLAKRIRNSIYTFGFVATLYGLYDILLDVTVVKDDKMKPAFEKGDVILSKKFRNKDTKAERNQIVLLYNPIKQQKIIRRILCVENDCVRCRNLIYVVPNSYFFVSTKNQRDMENLDLTAKKFQKNTYIISLLIG